MAGILKTALHAAASPKNRPEVKTTGLALLIAETRLFSLITVGNLRGFSHLSLADRRKVLDKIRAGNEQNRNIYAAFVNVSAATFYASDLTWPDIGYPGVSVDHPEILNRPPPVPWRPGDPRPVEP
ncbi:MAG: hypothetical protein ACJ754_24410 [Pyrinomonadaceae bacterium]